MSFSKSLQLCIIGQDFIPYVQQISRVNWPLLKLIISDKTRRRISRAHLSSPQKKTLNKQATQATQQGGAGAVANSFRFRTVRIRNDTPQNTPISQHKISGTLRRILHYLTSPFTLLSRFDSCMVFWGCPPKKRSLRITQGLLDPFFPTQFGSGKYSRPFEWTQRVFNGPMKNDPMAP